MSRKIRSTAILAKIETTAGTLATPASTDAILISDASFDLDYKNVDRNLIRPYFGHPGQLVGTRNVKIGFTCELFGSGTAGTAPAWGALLQACAFAETIAAGVSVEYTPVTSGLKTISILYHLDGITHTALGCMGNVTFGMKDGERPTMKFEFVGIDGGPAAASMPATSYTAWKVPAVVNSINSNKVKLGGTYAAAAVTGGTDYCSRGFEINMANDVKYLPLLGCTSVDIFDRKPTSSIALDLTAAQEVTMRSDINANTKTSLSLLHGLTAGNKVLMFAPNVARSNPKYEDYEGSVLVAMDLALEPLTGNDEIRIVSL